MTCGRVRRITATSRPVASSMSAMLNDSGCSFGGVSAMPGVPVAEHHDLVEADDAGRLGELGRAHRGDLGLLLLRRQPVERLARRRAAPGSAGRPPRRRCSTRAPCGRPRRGTGRRVGAPFDASSSGWAWTVSRVTGAGAVIARRPGLDRTSTYPRRVTASRVPYAPPARAAPGRRSLAAVAPCPGRGRRRLRHRRRQDAAAARRASERAAMPTTTTSTTVAGPASTPASLVPATALAGGGGRHGAVHGRPAVGRGRRRSTPRFTCDGADVSPR